MTGAEDSATAMPQDEAEERLMRVVDDLAEVQDNYDLTEDQQDMLCDAKSSVAAVYMHLDGEVVYDL